MSASAILIVATSVCSQSPKQKVLTADMPLHLEDHLDAATFSETAATPVAKADLPEPVEWRFDRPQPEWKATPWWHPPHGVPVATRTGDGLRLSLTGQSRTAGGVLRGAIRVDVPEWDRRDWAEVVVRARADATSSVNVLGLGFNEREGRGDAGASAAQPFQFAGEESAVVPDGTVRPYRLRINVGGGNFDGTWRQLFLYVGSTGAPGSIDVLSITVVPKGAVPAQTMVEWRFDKPQPDWKPDLRRAAAHAAVTEDVIERTDIALRVMLPESSRQANKIYRSGIYIDLPGWRREEWAYLIVRARTTSVTNMTVGLNPRSGAPHAVATQATFARAGGSTPIVSDGSEQTYQIRPDWGDRRSGPWLRLALEFRASEAGSIDVMSVSAVPTDALYAADSVGAQSIAIKRTYRQSLFVHAPGRLEYRVQVPEDGQLQGALGVLNSPVEFRVTVRPAKGETTTVFRETHTDPERWAEQTLDLSSFAGQVITLGLETASDTTGAVAFWGSPTLSGTRRSDKPNVILYIIDGAGADYMGIYGYNRRTTPHLEKLAAEGMVFEQAYSNSSWTKPSTASFMTSLHNSVLGFGGGDFDPIPEQAVTMAQHFHRAGYRTAVLTPNPNAATNSGLQRGADLLQESEVRRDATSSVKLHQAFWIWRSGSSGQPYWVHFQTTDLHAVTGGSELNLRDGVPVPPFAGLFVSPADVAALREWSARVMAGGGGRDSEAFTTGAVNRSAYFTLLQGMYDQQMAHNDYQLGRLVEQLKASGEWEDTLLIVAADHSLDGFFGTDMTERIDPVPPGWTWSTLRPTVSRIPLIMVWPGHITGGQRFGGPVSMIDVLPTVLDLTGLPRPEVMQGQSLAPLLQGKPGWVPKPVIMDEIVTFSGQDQNVISVIDGRWGASMRLLPASGVTRQRQPWPVLLFDLWNDPMCVAPVNEQHPDLVDKYTKFLLDQWKDHQALAKQFEPGPKVALTPEQLERLRSLGYIR